MDGVRNKRLELLSVNKEAVFRSMTKALRGRGKGLK